MTACRVKTCTRDASREKCARGLCVPHALTWLLGKRCTVEKYVAREDDRGEKAMIDVEVRSSGGAEGTGSVPGYMWIGKPSADASGLVATSTCAIGAQRPSDGVVVHIRVRT